jgi:hypothetical protein
MTENDSFNPYEKWLGIPLAEQPPSYYRLLGVEEFEAAAECLTRAADERMIHIRTFQTGPRGALTQKLLNEISAARICLTDDEARGAYDRLLRGEASDVPTQVQAPSSSNNPMAPLGTVAVDPMAPLGPGPGSMDPMAPIVSPTVSPTVAVQTVPLVAISTPQPVAQPVAQTFTAPASTLGVVTSATPTSRVRRQRKRSAVVMLLMTTLAIGAVAGSVWGIGQLMKQNEERKSQATEQRKDKDADGEEPKTTLSVSDSAIMAIQGADGRVSLTPVLAKLNGGGLFIETDNEASYITNWTSEEQSVEWRFRIVRTGLFTVRLNYSAPAANEVLIEIGNEAKVFEARDSKGENRFVDDHVYMKIETPGEHTLKLSPQSIIGSIVMRLKVIELIPRDL